MESLQRTATSGHRDRNCKKYVGSFEGFESATVSLAQKDKWDTYQVGDGATQVSVLQDGKTTEIFFGKSTYSQGGAYTYVRLSKEDEVYAIEGFIDSHFNRTYNDWRNKTLLKLNQADISKITFNYPADSSFVLEKRDSVWFAANAKAADAKVNSYVSQLSFKTLNDFADGFSSAEKPTLTLQIESKNGVLATVQGWKNGEQWILTSSTQSGVYFSAAQSIAQELLAAKGKFLE
ncbi:MAG: DUF4340 domain-containing protein [Flammeovirgaceae bacterium]|nr:DUF4340 domain-containing protein [Flammeovirgaceae bacterium]